jgi:hypothetical protein
MILSSYFVLEVRFESASIQVGGKCGEGLRGKEKNFGWRLHDVRAET